MWDILILEFSWILFILFNGVMAGEYCTVLGEDHYYEQEYCAFGCCHRSCCSSVGPVTGIVIGIAAVAGILIALICCCRNTPGTQGRVITTPQNIGYSSTATGVHQQPGEHGYIYPAPQYTHYPPPDSNHMYRHKSHLTTGSDYQSPRSPYGYPLQEMPTTVPTSHTETHETQRKSYTEPSAPPPPYEEVQNLPKS